MDWKSQLPITRFASLLGVLFAAYGFFSVDDPGVELPISQDAPQVRSVANNSGDDSRLPHLLFITLDGVRPDEFGDCLLVRPEKLAKSDCSFPGIWAGVRSGEFEVTGMTVGNSRNLSLPGYQSIYSGANQDKTCQDNKNCTQVPTQTWLEKIRLVRQLPASDVAVIASWNKMPRAVESNPGTLFVNAGISPMTDPTRNGQVPPELELENRWQSDPDYVPEWTNARADRFTFTYAQWYLTHVKPVVLAIGLLDSDELGHLDRFEAYRRKLRTYDSYIQTLLQDLKDSGLYDRTIVIVTTDHGRGGGYFGYAFQGHGPEWYHAHSHRAWAAISVPEAYRSRWRRTKAKLLRSGPTQLDIRPVVEALLLPSR